MEVLKKREFARGETAIRLVIDTLVKGWRTQDGRQRVERARQLESTHDS